MEIATSVNSGGCLWCYSFEIWTGRDKGRETGGVLRRFCPTARAIVLFFAARVLEAPVFVSVNACGHTLFGGVFHA